MCLCHLSFPTTPHPRPLSPFLFHFFLLSMQQTFPIEFTQKAFLLNRNFLGMTVSYESGYQKKDLIALWTVILGCWTAHSCDMPLNMEKQPAKLQQPSWSILYSPTPASFWLVHSSGSTKERASTWSSDAAVPVFVLSSAGHVNWRAMCWENAKKKLL